MPLKDPIKRKEYNKNYRISHRKQRNEYNKENNKKHKHRINMYRKKYYIEHKEEEKKKSKLYYQTHVHPKTNPEKRLVIMKRHLEKYGKTFEMNPSEFSFALQAWSKTIKKLDNFICKNCGNKENLNAHHIQPKQDFPELALDTDNGITLCKTCHENIHCFEIY